jgi:hypothetical protein
MDKVEDSYTFDYSSGHKLSGRLFGTGVSAFRGFRLRFRA